MSIFGNIRNAARNIREAFEYSELYPGSRLAAQARALRDFDIQGHVARMRELEDAYRARHPEAGHPEADPDLYVSQDGADYQAAGGIEEVTRDDAAGYDPRLDPESVEYDAQRATDLFWEDPRNDRDYKPPRPVAEIRADYNTGSLTRRELEDQEADREREAGTQAYWDEIEAAPAVEWTDADANRMERELEAAEEAAREEESDEEGYDLITEPDGKLASVEPAGDAAARAIAAEDASYADQERATARKMEYPAGAERQAE
jgi:hypothetical protein